MLTVAGPRHLLSDQRWGGHVMIELVVVLLVTAPSVLAAVLAVELARTPQALVDEAGPSKTLWMVLLILAVPAWWFGLLASVPYFVLVRPRIRPAPEADAS